METSSHIPETGCWQSAVCTYLHTHTQVVHGVCVNSSSLSHPLTSSSPYRKLIRRCLCLYMRDQAFSTGDLLPTQMSPELQRKILPEIKMVLYTRRVRHYTRGLQQGKGLWPLWPLIARHSPESNNAPDPPHLQRRVGCPAKVSLPRHFLVCIVSGNSH